MTLTAQALLNESDGIKGEVGVLCNIPFKIAAQAFQRQFDVLSVRTACEKL